MFDKIVEKNKIEYGIINGNSKLFFIKVGNGGSIYGQENRYLKMAEQIHNVRGCSVEKNADHNFENMSEEFVSLPERFLF